jgi:peptidoglycan L-alanyl-D-glutamate endopeptidase CwlK
MPRFGTESNNKLVTCHPMLQRLFSEVVKYFDCTILEGHRSLKRQKELIAQGKSKTMNSKHCTVPSLAADVAPYPIDWNDLQRFYFFAGVVKGIATQLGITIRWGGDWDSDTEVKDNTFNDLVHFELILSASKADPA